MEDLFTEDGQVLDLMGRKFSHLSPIFEHHQIAKYISKVKDVQYLSKEIAVLRAIAGMISPQTTELNHKVNTHHTPILKKDGGVWRIQVFQNTPA